MNSSIMKDIKTRVGVTRYEHILRVSVVAEELAIIHKVDVMKAKKAALLHDCAKIQNEELLLEKAKDFNVVLTPELLENVQLIHAKLGARIAEEIYGVHDEDILNAISYHTTGRKNMSDLEKIIFIADYIEPARRFQGIEEIRDLAFVDIDKSILKALNLTMDFLISRNQLISLDSLEARNQLIIDKKELQYDK